MKEIPKTCSECGSHKIIVDRFGKYPEPEIICRDCGLIIGFLENAKEKVVFT